METIKPITEIMTARFRWGILGTAGICGRMIRAIRNSSNSEVIAVASRDPGRVERWAKEHAIPHICGSYEELLGAGIVDGVYLPLPNSRHAEWTIKALEAGCPVLCEKPLTANLAEAQQVKETAERCGLHVAEAFMYRYHPMFDRIQAMIRAGNIGEVCTIHSRFTFMLDDRSANAASAALAGGALLDVGCYCVNVVRLLTGQEPARVSAFERRSTVDDTVVGLLDFPNGVLAQFEASLASFERHQVEVAGTRGAIVIDQPWIPGEGETGFTLYREGSPPEAIRVPGADAYQLQVEHFVEVVRGRIAARWSLEDAVASMRVLDAIGASARRGQTIAV